MSIWWVSQWMKDWIMWTLFRSCLWQKDENKRKGSVSEDFCQTRIFTSSALSVCQFFTCRVSLNLQPSYEVYAIWYPFYVWEKWDVQKFKNWLMRTEPVNDVDGTQPSPSSGSRRPFSNPTPMPISESRGVSVAIMPGFRDASFWPRNKDNGNSCLLYILWEVLMWGKLCRGHYAFPELCTVENCSTAIIFLSCRCEAATQIWGQQGS